MNAETFYQELKEALDYFGLAWRDKHLVTVTLASVGVLFTYEHRTVLVQL